MNLLIRFLLFSILLFSTTIAIPAFADDPATSVDSENTATTAASQGSSTSSANKDTKGRRSLSNSESQLEALKDPEKRMEAMGNISELLGIAAALMLVTGSSMAFCLKKHKLFGLMLAVGVIGGIEGLAAPGLIIMSGNEAAATAIFAINFLLYFAVFFLPTILAHKDNTVKKLKITLINVAGFIVPGAGLIALYVALKDKPSTAEQPAGQ